MNYFKPTPTERATEFAWGLSYFIWYVCACIILDHGYGFEHALCCFVKFTSKAVPYKNILYQTT